MSGSGFSYKGVDIGNVVTSNDPANSPTFSDYNLQYTPTSYDYQKPLDFNLSQQGISLHNDCTAVQSTITTDVTNEAAPVYAKSVRLLMRGGQGGKGGQAGNAKAKANSFGGGSNSATGYGGSGGAGGWGTTYLTSPTVSIDTGAKYTVTIGKIGNTGATGQSNSRNTNGTTTSGVGGTGGQGNTTSITFYDSNGAPQTPQSVLGGPGGFGGNEATAKTNGFDGNTSSNQGNTGTQPNYTSTEASVGSSYPDIAPAQSDGFVQIVWLYD